MKRTLYKQAGIATENQGTLVQADVLVEGTSISAVGQNLAADPSCEVVECQGLVMMPGLFDVHVHARQPGFEHKENIETCSLAAINGGITGYVMMPNTSPALDSGITVRNLLDQAAQVSRIPVYTTGCITKGRAGKELAGIAGMKANGVLMLTDDGDPVEDAQVLRLAMEYAKDFDLPLASHCEVKSLSARGSMNEGSVSYRLGLRGIPACSEEICLDRDIRLAQHTGTHIHIQHVSSRRGMETIRWFKQQGVHVTCEVAPHHLLFTEENIGAYDTHYKMNPPLRTREDTEALLQGLIEGIFDVIATDHAPHSAFEKSQDFGSAPFGITGLETALPSLFHHFIRPGLFGWDVLVKRYSAEPRRLMKMPVVSIAPGQTAEFVLFDPRRKSVFTREFMRSKSQNTPFLDRELDGLVTRVVYQGNVLLAR